MSVARTDRTTLRDHYLHARGHTIDGEFVTYFKNGKVTVSLYEQGHPDSHHEVNACIEITPATALAVAFQLRRSAVLAIEEGKE